MPKAFLKWRMIFLSKNGLSLIRGLTKFEPQVSNRSVKYIFINIIFENFSKVWIDLSFLWTQGLLGLGEMKIRVVLGCNELILTLLLLLLFLMVKFFVNPQIDEKPFV